MANEIKLTEDVSSNLLDQAVDWLGLPIRTISRMAYERYCRARIEAAREELLQSFFRGEASPDLCADEDEAIGVIHRYLVAVRDGAARRNMRLMADVIAGMYYRQKLFRDDFSKHAEALAGLSRDEIIVAGRVYKLFIEALAVAEKEPVKAAEGAETTPWDHALEQSFQKLMLDLVPNIFAYEREVIGILGSLNGAGLVLAYSGWDSIIYGPTDRLLEIGQMVDFEAAARIRDF